MSGAIDVPRWLLTDHAIERYRERVNRRATYEQAIEELQRDIAGGHLVRKEGEIEHWKGARPRQIRFRVRRAPDGTGEVFTVIEAHDGLQRYRR